MPTAALSSFASVLVSTLASTLALGSATPQASVPPGPGIHFIAVGQGAAALLVGEGVSVLVDVGPAAGAEAIHHALAVHGVERLDLLVATHFDADHIGGLGPVRVGPDGRPGTGDEVEIARAWDRGLLGPLPQTDALALYLGLLEGRREAPELGARFDGPGLTLEVVGVGRAEASENQRGLILCAEIAGLRALLPGDAAAAQVEAAAEACGPVDLLWASHHGSADGSSARALERADPRVTVASAGHANSYCHPAPTTLALLHDRPALVLDAAGLWRSESCPAIASALGPAHQLVGGDLWIAAPSLEPWCSSGELWVRLP